MNPNDQNNAAQPQPGPSAPPNVYVEPIAYVGAAPPVNYWNPVAVPERTTITFNPSDPRHAAVRVAQAPANYSSSQEGTSVANSHTPYNIRIEQERIKKEKERNRAIQAASKTPIVEKDDEKTLRTMTTTEEGSFYSYHSSRDLSTFLREANGRMFNNQSDLYMLPSDDDEFQRLAKQHYSLALCMGGLTPCEDLVHDILNPERHPDPTVPAGILDLGCGSGIWAMEMAQHNPHASVVGVDLAPVAFDQSTMPGNIRFEIDDITMGLTHYYNKFDVVQVRCITGGIPNYRLMMHDVEACLRPGGVVIFIDGDTLVFSEDCLTPVPAAVDAHEPGGPIEGSWVQRLARETRFASIHQGCDTVGAEHEITKGLWGHPLIEPDTVRVASLFTPIGPWPTSSDIHLQQKVRYAGSLMRQDVIRMIRAWHPLLKAHGISSDTLELWTQRADDELEKMKYRYSWHWMLTWGQRRIEEESGSPPHSRESSPFSNDEGEQQQPDPSSSTVPAPAPTPAPTPASTSTAPSTEPATTNPAPAPAATGFRPLQIRTTREEALEFAQIHLEGLCSLPTPTINLLRQQAGLDAWMDDVKDLS